MANGIEQGNEKTEQPKNNNTTNANHETDLSRNQVPPQELSTTLGGLHEVEITNETARARETGDLTKITSEAEFRSATQDLIKQAKEGKSVNFSVDARVTLTGADGKPGKETQASMLYEELAKAYPERNFTFSKRPDEFPFQKVAKDNLQISTKENMMTTDREVTMKDGTKIPAGSSFSNGTTFDGKELKSADPTGKVWAVTAEGQYIQVAGEGQSAEFPADAIKKDLKDKKGPGQLVNRQGTDAKTGQTYDNVILMRQDPKAKAPDGKPLLDYFPTGGPSYEAAYVPGSKEGTVKNAPKMAEHFRLPENMKVESQTPWGGSTSSGAKEDYYMKSGFADAKEPTAHNYSGANPGDPRSAQEVMRIRNELGMTEPSLVERAEVKRQLEAKFSGGDPTRLEEALNSQANESARRGAELGDTEAGRRAALEADIIRHDMLGYRHGEQIAPPLETNPTNEKQAEFDKLMKEMPHALGGKTRTTLEWLSKFAKLSDYSSVESKPEVVIAAFESASYSASDYYEYQGIKGDEAKARVLIGSAIRDLSTVGIVHPDLQYSAAQMASRLPLREGSNHIVAGGKEVGEHRTTTERTVEGAHPSHSNGRRITGKGAFGAVIIGLPAVIGGVKVVENQFQRAGN